jgi:hypothetical protein
MDNHRTRVSSLRNVFLTLSSIRLLSFIYLHPCRPGIPFSRSYYASWSLNPEIGELGIRSAAVVGWRDYLRSLPTFRLIPFWHDRGGPHCMRYGRAQKYSIEVHTPSLNKTRYIQGHAATGK